MPITTSEQYSNLGSSTCTGSLDNSTNPTSIVVASGAGANFPSTTNGPFRIVVCDATGTNAEVMIVTTRATDTFSGVYRGSAISTYGAQETPIPTLSTHSAGSTVVQAITVGAMDQIRTEAYGYGTLAGRPTAPRVAGAIYRASDALVDEYRWNGTSWDAFAGRFKVNPQGTASFGTSVVGGAGTLVAFANQGGTDGGFILSGTTTNDGADALIGQFQALATAPYTITLRFAVTCAPLAKFEYAGLALRDSSSGKILTWGWNYQGNAYSFGSTPILRHAYWNSPTSYSGTSKYAQSWAGGHSKNGWLTVQISDNGTNRIHRVSADGLNFVVVYSSTNTEFFTPNQMGVFVIPYDNVSTLSVVDFSVANQ
ncbi:MAG TPA: hypothetical protein VKX49_13100 [Bryobacteraceae bacterium]|nr:hypothetical protein [Bryobacteraceae bacterium]